MLYDVTTCIFVSSLNCHRQKIAAYGVFATFMYNYELWIKLHGFRLLTHPDRCGHVMSLQVRWETAGGYKNKDLLLIKEPLSKISILWNHVQTAALLTTCLIVSVLLPASVAISWCCRGNVQLWPKCFQHIDGIKKKCCGKRACTLSQTLFPE